MVRVVLEPTMLTVIDENGDEHQYGITPYQYELAIERVLPSSSRRAEDHFWHTVKHHIPW